MDAFNVIDVGFDFRDDTPPGKDPDKSSPTLRRYHKLLWSKPLPDGRMFELDDTTSGEYLHHKSDLGEFHLASDAMVASFRYLPMVQDEPEQLKEFMHIGYTIGGMMLWPGNRVDGKMTINGWRGFSRKTRDRVDLTMECIRRHYLSEWSPMQDCLARYADFFRLFGDFRGFVEFFLLQDAVTVDCDAVIFSTPFSDFTTPALPQTMSEYRKYRQAAIAFTRPAIAGSPNTAGSGLWRIAKESPMMNARDASKSEFDQRRTREIEIDVLVGHECASRGPVSDLLWKRAGLDPPSGPVKVEYQQLCGDGRVGDVRVTAHDGHQLLIEDKAAGGVFQQGQVENYQRVATTMARTMLIAPAGFLRVHQREASCFSAAVSLEEISDTLESTPQDAQAELAASYAHRRGEFLRCARDPGWVGNPDDDVRAFGDCYRRLAREVTDGEIALTPNTLTNASARTVEFMPWARHDNFKPFHKLHKGLLDVRVKGFSLQELRERLHACEAQTRCPKGWTPAEQGKGKGNYPVLSYRVGAIGGDLSADAFDEVRPILVEALQALCDLKSWWERDGARLLPLSP